MADDIVGRRGYLGPRPVEGFDPAIDRMSDEIDRKDAEILALRAANERLRAENTVAKNRLGNAVRALLDAGTFCFGPEDVSNGIARLGEMAQQTPFGIRITMEQLVQRLTDLEAERDDFACNLGSERALADQLAEALKAAREAMCDYAGQGTGTDPETPEWQDYCISTWESVPDDLAAVDSALAAYEAAHKEGQ